MSYDEFDEELDEEEKAEYDRNYIDEINRSGAGLKDHERDEIFDELTARHNFRRSGDGSADARRNFLESEKAIRDSQDNQDPHLTALMAGIDERKGPGSARKMLREADNPDSAYFAQLKKEGKIDE